MYSLFIPSEESVRCFCWPRIFAVVWMKEAIQIQKLNANTRAWRLWCYRVPHQSVVEELILSPQDGTPNIQVILSNSLNIIKTNSSTKSAMIWHDVVSRTIDGQCLGYCNHGTHSIVCVSWTWTLRLYLDNLQREKTPRSFETFGCLLWRLRHSALIDCWYRR
jgi:hypothetical protein